MHRGQLEGLERRRLLAAYELDLSFGEGGIAPLHGDTGDLYVVGQLGNGKIVAVGGTDGLFVARFNADGTPDTSFDGDGRLRVGPQAHISAAQRASDGKFVAVGSAGEEAWIFRLNADGTPDSSFGGGDGQVEFADVGRGFGIQSDGKIVMAVAKREAPQQLHKTYLVRFNADGTADNTFSSTPTSPVFLPFEGGSSEVVTAPDNKIYLIKDDDQTGLAMRFNVNGTVDTTFGGDGSEPVLNHGDDTFTMRLLSSTVDASGRLIVASQYWDGPNSRGVAVTRFALNGQHDPTFGGGDGWVVTANEDDNWPRDVVVGSDGKITGTVWHAGYMFRVNADGTPDTTFGPGGWLTPNRELPAPGGLAFGANGSLLLAGQVSEPYFLAVARFVPASVNSFVSANGSLFVEGGEGNDTITLSQSGGQIVVDVNGTKTLHAAAGVNRIAIYGDRGNDVISVPLALAMHIEGGDGDDQIALGNGDATILGGDGNDIITAGEGDRDIDAGKGSNRITTGFGHDRVGGGDGNDTIRTGGGGDHISSGSGDDSIVSGNGSDVIYTGEGRDTVFANGGDDIVHDIPYPTIDGGISSVGRFSGVKFYFGGDGSDSLYGSKENDTLNGNAGDDTIYGSAGDDTIVGEAGNDLLHTDHSELPGSSNKDTISGGDGDDEIHGSYGTDLLMGDAGDDYIDPDGGNDTVYGGTGNDRLGGQLVSIDHLGDTIYGEDGNDTIYGSWYDDSLWGNGGSDRIFAGDGKDSIYGNGGNDRMEGGAQSDHIRGNAGHDRLFGNGGHDRLYGGESGDSLYGQAGLDQLLGEGGTDRLYGDDGEADTLRGGAGNDVLITLDSVIDQLFGDGGRDSANRDDNDIFESIEVRL